MLTGLKVIHDMLESVNQSTNNKEDVLRNFLSDPIFGKTLRRTLEYVTDKKHFFRLKRIRYCVFFDDKVAAEHQNVDSIFDMLDYLSEKPKDSSDDEISFLEKISSSDVETVEVVTRILNKMSGCGLVNETIVSILEEPSGE